jgi:hydroxymethylpyrimidine/phosphomethylpyrimidine kinase
VDPAWPGIATNHESRRNSGNRIQKIEEFGIDIAGRIAEENFEPFSVRFRESELSSRVMKIVLAIAGSDPTGGAGLQADLQVIRHFGCHGMGVISALTIQDTSKVHSVLPVFPSVVLDQLRCLVRDVTPHAVKIGMLASDDVVRNTSLGLASVPPEVPIVIDPILFASDGTPLLERRAWPALQSLFSRATLVTPNLPEAEALTGVDVSNREGCERAARVFIDEYECAGVLLKGGHREGAPDDLLVIRDGGELAVRWLPGRRVETLSGPVHGTGCALSSAIAAELAKGSSLETATERARSFVNAALADAHAAGSGAQLLGYSSAS